MDKVTLISDLHTFSNWGLMHPDYKAKGIMYVPNEMQEWTFDFWKDRVVRSCKDSDAFVFNGDMIDGKNKYNYGAVGSTDIYEQVDMSEMLIDMLPADTPKFFMKGTGFHSGDEVVAEQLLADKLGWYYAPEAIIEVCGIRIFSNHFAPHAQNKAGVLEKKIRELAAAEACYGKIDVLNLAHNHKFAATITQSHIGIITPGFQHKTPYAIDKNLIPPSDIGFVDLLIEDRELITVDRRNVVQSPFGPQVLTWEESWK
jgi:hypothetical protein